MYYLHLCVFSSLLCCFVRPFCVNCWGVCVGVGNTFETFAVDISANSKYFLLSLKKIKYPARRTLFSFFCRFEQQSPIFKVTCAHITSMPTPKVWFPHSTDLPLVRKPRVRGVKVWRTCYRTLSWFRLTEQQNCNLRVEMVALWVQQKYRLFCSANFQQWDMWVPVRIRHWLTGTVSWSPQGNTKIQMITN